MELFHYTSAFVIQEIVLKRKIWATNINYMNDSKEGAIPRERLRRYVNSKGAHGLGVDEYLKEAIEYFLNKNKHSFVACFSAGHDNLSLYRTYTPPDGGYAIGFESDYLNKIPTTELIGCEYARDNHDGEILRYLKDLIQALKSYDRSGISPLELCNNFKETGQFLNRLAHMSDAFKSDSFASENESRLVGRDWEKRELRASSRGNFLIPYVPIELPNIETNVRISIGPNSNLDLAIKGIQELPDIARRQGCKWNISIGGFGGASYRYI
ncbi:DUF2971 domain-containing protein [Marinobacter sp. 1_MG-2023]|uniref:DUF2971 domain-containing protein n=1 Tax=Marinobacter sp. 1_MG-2023 TaxID=3062627 RepID=UPI0026E45BCA|nr:DUF2971 domain-containing protein [Marinobacter sp. 1_MG-2023]MDO6822275.1 DUF2971 domain-containing protein [Marinobacter sp. 1_MG-2023]